MAAKVKLNKKGPELLAPARISGMLEEV